MIRARQDVANQRFPRLHMLSCALTGFFSFPFLQHSFPKQDGEKAVETLSIMFTLQFAHVRSYQCERGSFVFGSLPGARHSSAPPAYLMAFASSPSAGDPETMNMELRGIRCAAQLYT